MPAKLLGLASRALLTTLLILPISQAVAADPSFLRPMGPVAQEQADHILRITLISMIAILPVVIGVPIILWRYNYSKGRGEYRPQWDFSRNLELLIWGIPIAIFLSLSAALVYSVNKLDPYEPLGPDPLRVQAIGLDWKWVFIYPDQGIATVNELAVPVGRPIELTLTTDTVMQSFIVSPLAGQIYAMPGMTTKLNFIADKQGIAEGENTQFNGDGFGRQKFTVRALSGADYENWLRNGGKDITLDETTYPILRRQSVLVQARNDLGMPHSAEPIFMELSDPSLFDKVVSKYHTHRGANNADTLGGIGAPPKDVSKDSK